MGTLEEGVESPVLYMRAPRELTDVEDQYAGYVKTVKVAINKTQKALDNKIESVATTSRKDITSVKTDIETKMD